MINQVQELLSTNEVYQIKVTEGRIGKIRIAHDTPLPRGSFELEVAKITAKEYGITVALMDQGNPYRNEFLVELVITDPIEALPVALNLIRARKHFDRAMLSLAELAFKKALADDGKQMIT